MALGKPSLDLSLENYHLGCNPNDLDFYHEFDVEDIQTSNELTTYELREVAARALASGLVVTLAKGTLPDILAIAMPAGDAERLLWIDRTNARYALDSEFERYEYLPTYDAIWHAGKNHIEASLVSANGGQLLRSATGPVEVSNRSGLTVRLDSPSAPAQVLLDSIYHPDPRVSTTVSLIGTSASSSRQAEAALEWVGETFLFQHDLAANEPAYLVQRTRRYRFDEFGSRKPDEVALEYEYHLPDERFRSDPMRLYMYGRSLTPELPLIQFLVYYQAIEYFLPYYSRLATLQTLRAAVMDPTFDATSDDSLVRILESVEPRRSEKDQLRAAITHCVDCGHLRRFLGNLFQMAGLNRAPSEHLRGLRALCAEAEHSCDARSLAPADCECDQRLLRLLTERIYELRNRIVHAKGVGVFPGKRKPIFPFTEEARQLQADVALIRYVAAAIICASPEGNDSLWPLTHG
jgi:hypothetical protein